MIRRQTTRLRRLLPAALLAFGMGAVAPASATLMITVDSLANGVGIDFTAIDGESGDGVNDLFNNEAGALAAIGSIDGLGFFMAAFSGAPDRGELVDISAEFSRSSTAGAFEIRISDDRFELGDRDSARASSLITPTTVSHSITVETLVDGQTVLDTDELVSGVNQSASSLVNLSEPSTIEHIIRIAAGGHGFSTFDTRTVVPEPGTLSLLGAGLLGLGFLRRKKIV